MPTIEASRKDLEKLIGKKLAGKELEEALMYVKGELDEEHGDRLKIDIKETNRPDLWSVEGIARELRARLGIRKGLPKIKTSKGKVKLIIEKSVKKSRPLMAAAIARNVKVTGEFLIQMIQLQEKVGLTFGRKRKETGIGLYDMDKIKPPIYYRGYRPRELKFAPLESEKEMRLDEILEHYPKGKEYAHLVKEFERYPIVIDSRGTVCSMPPIINSNHTGKVTEETKNIFIEVTGWKEQYVHTALNVIVAALHERGAKIETVQVIDGGKKFHTPDFTPKKAAAKADYFRKISGMPWTDKQITHLLEKAGYDAKTKGGKTEVKYPAYRQDILHPIDLVEDAIISQGYNNFEPTPPAVNSKGKELQKTEYIGTIRDACIGLGLQEVLTFNLTSKETQEKKMMLKEQEFVEIANPVSANWQVFRKNILPELLSFLAKNKHAGYPQRIFEIGKIVEADKKSETAVREPVRICILLCHERTNYTEIKTILDALAKAMGWKTSVQATEHSSFEKGRTGTVSGEISGTVGELNPKVLENFGIETKTSALEIEISLE